MEYFRLVQKHMAFLGISLIQQPFNKRILTTFSLCTLNCVFTCIFLIFEPNNFREYIEAVYLTSSAIATNIQFITFVYGMEQIFTLIETMADIVKKSESTFYDKIEI